jgi:hypothetical protein
MPPPTVAGEVGEGPDGETSSMGAE